jgi:ATP-dependent protease ClpP protease subunit
MYGLYDVIRTRRNKVHTIGFGELFSAGVLLAASGDKRSATENAWMMSHPERLEETDVKDACGGEIYAIQQRVNWILAMEDQWAALMGKHTRRGTKWWHDLHRGKHRETWWCAKDMLQLGIVDEIIPDTAPPEPKGGRRARSGGRA